MYYVYIATNLKNNKKYVGVTNNLNRRIREHLRSSYDFGKALQEFGLDCFNFQLLDFETSEEAFEFEGLAVGLEEANSDKFYNMMPGGVPNNFQGDYNPMRRESVKQKHPSMFTTENNPMNCAVSKQKMIENQKRKSVIIDDVEYPGVREAARVLNMSRQKLVYRLKSIHFPTYQYKNHSG